MVIPLFVPSRWRRASRYVAETTAAGPSTGLLATDPDAATQQGAFFPASDQYPTQTVVQHDPFPPSTEQFPTRENPFPQR